MNLVTAAHFTRGVKWHHEIRSAPHNLVVGEPHRLQDVTWFAVRRCTSQAIGNSGLSLQRDHSRLGGQSGKGQIDHVRQSARESPVDLWI